MPQQMPTILRISVSIFGCVRACEIYIDVIGTDKIKSNLKIMYIARLASYLAGMYHRIIVAMLKCSMVAHNLPVLINDDT